MTFKTIDPAVAHDLLGRGQGYIYIDVRSEAEFAAGHPEGARNVPLFHKDEWGRMTPNPDFMRVVEALYPKDAPLLLGCAMGGRSARACGAMATAGWTDLSNVHGGFAGHPGGPDASSDPGWAGRGLPVSVTLEGRAYADLKAAAEG